MYSVPILLIIFNRPDTTVKVMERIRQQKPYQLFIASDGPRKEKHNEEDVVISLREQVLQMIDWDCTVHTLFRDENYGCGKNPADSITWFFKYVDKGIILEDDILPNPSFFSFMKEMLDKYEFEKEVMQVTGQNFQFGKKRGSGSYYFSRYPLIWGWGTWKRAWAMFDYMLDTITFEDISNMPLAYQQIFQRMKTTESDIWDYQWTFSVWKYKGKCIVPQVNLIENLGFGAGATHTFNTPWWYKKIKNGVIKEIVDPKTMEVNEKADQLFIDRILNNKRFS